MGAEPSGIFLARPEHIAEGIPLAVKDLFDTAGLTTTYGSIVYADHVPEESAEAVDAPRGGRLRERREDEPPRVRVRHHLGQSALRHGSEPRLSGPHGRRLEWRLGSGTRGRARRCGARDRLRRLDPDPGGVLRRRRLQADVRARLARRRLPAGAELRPRRPDGALGSGVRGDDAFARGQLRAEDGRIARGGRGRDRMARPGGPVGSGARAQGKRALPPPPRDRLPARREDRPCVHA